jgi:ABC-2 type transport system ATP-binding protein
VREVAVEGRTLRARADHGARAVPSVLAALEAAGLTAASVTVSRASLDDVYLRYTGRTFEAAESGHGAGRHLEAAGSEPVPKATTAGSR